MKRIIRRYGETEIGLRFAIPFVLRFSVPPVNPFPPYPPLSLAREWIRPHLELHELALGPLTAFDVPHEVRAVVGVERATFPAGLWIVDAAVEPARIEPQWIRHAQSRPLLRLRIENQEGIGVRSGRDRFVLTHAERVVLVDPVEVVEVGGDVGAAQFRAVGL